MYIEKKNAIDLFLLHRIYLPRGDPAVVVVVVLITHNDADTLDSLQFASQRGMATKGGELSRFTLWYGCHS